MKNEYTTIHKKIKVQISYTKKVKNVSDSVTESQTRMGDTE